MGCSFFLIYRLWEELTIYIYLKCYILKELQFNYPKHSFNPPITSAQVIDVNQNVRSCC